MKKSSQKDFIYFRYILPIIVAVLMLIAMLVPVYRFITAESGINAAVSLGELVKNSWDTVRNYIFGASATKDEATLYFSKVVLAVVVVCVLLFALGVASVVYAAVVALGYFSDGCRESSRRAMFITLVPNRVVLCVYHALMLPIFFIPMLMPYLYKTLLDTHVELSCRPFDMVFVALVLYVAQTVVIAVSSEYESARAMNVFVRRKPFEKASRTELVREEPKKENDAYAEISNRAKQEQLDKVLRLINKTDEKEDEQ